MKQSNSQAMSFGPDQRVQFMQIPPLDVLGMLRMAWHGKWLIMASTVMAIACGTYYAFEMKGPQFAAVATLQLDARQAHLGDVADQLQTPATDAASLNTEVTILTTDSILEQVISQLDLGNDPEFNRYLTPISPFAVNSIRGQIRQFLSGTTDAPPDASAIAQKTVQNLRGRLSAQRPRDTYLFQITARSSDPDKAAAIANSAATAYISAQLDAQATAADAAISWLGQRVATLKAQLEQQEIAVTNLIATAQVQEETALDVLSTAVMAVDEERAAAFASLASYNQKNDTSARDDATIAQISTQISEIDARSARLRGRLAAQSTGIVALQQMQREADATRNLYQSFLARLQETQVQRGLAYPDSRLIAPATAGHYVGPQKTLLISAAGLLGGLIGLAFVVAGYITRKGVLHPLELRQKTDKPVFASFSEAETRLEGIVGPDRQISPAMRKVRAGLMRTTGEEGPQVVMITSSTCGEGAAALAVALAQGTGSGGQRTLLMLADPKSDSLKKIFASTESQPSPRTEDAISFPSLDFEVLSDSKVESVFSNGFGVQLDKLRGQFDNIVILAPPVLTASDTQLLAHYADVVIYAVRWEKTPLSAVQRGLDTLEQNSTVPMGLALTRTNGRKMRRYAAIAGAPILGLEIA